MFRTGFHAVTTCSHHFPFCTRNHELRSWSQQQLAELVRDTLGSFPPLLVAADATARPLGHPVSGCPWQQPRLRHRCHPGQGRPPKRPALDELCPNRGGERGRRGRHRERSAAGAGKGPAEPSAAAGLRAPHCPQARPWQLRRDLPASPRTPGAALPLPRLLPAHGEAPDTSSPSIPRAEPPKSPPPAPAPFPLSLLSPVPGSCRSWGWQVAGAVPPCQPSLCVPRTLQWAQLSPSQRLSQGIVPPCSWDHRQGRKYALLTIPANIWMQKHPQNYSASFFLPPFPAQGAEVIRTLPQVPLPPSLKAPNPPQFRKASQLQTQEEQNSIILLFTTDTVVTAAPVAVIVWPWPARCHIPEVSQRGFPSALAAAPARGSARHASC
ncbi:WAS/WASL-interacting protein family member 3-like isoform X2 [Passer montanus]|nr:WAS/WASL-interacting protein family member 3-like isoform X2 [Passer montanus]